MHKRKPKKKNNAPGGTRTPDPGLIRPMLYQTELPELKVGSSFGPRGGHKIGVPKTYLSQTQKKNRENEHATGASTIFPHFARVVKGPAR